MAVSPERRRKREAAADMEARTVFPVLTIRAIQGCAGSGDVIVSVNRTQESPRTMKRPPLWKTALPGPKCHPRFCQLPPTQGKRTGPIHGHSHITHDGTMATPASLPNGTPLTHRKHGTCQMDSISSEMSEKGMRTCGGSYATL